METENNLNVFSASITYNSKIRELSDGNRVIESQTIFCHRFHHFLVMSYGNRDMSYEN